MYYGDYEVKETKKTFFVSQAYWDDSKPIVIPKNMVHELGIDEEPQKVAIVLAKIESNKYYARTRKRGKGIIRLPGFIDKFKDIYMEKNLDEIFYDIAELNYDDTMNYFFPPLEDIYYDDIFDENSYD